MLNQKPINAQAVKVDLIKQLMNKGAQFALDECGIQFGICDVFSVSPHGYSTEWEIKMSKQDLMSEINAIDCILKGQHERRKEFAKYDKHRALMKKEVWGWHPEVGYYPRKLEERHILRMPNYFSFVIPQTMLDFALPILKDTPYGITVFWQYEGKDWLSWKREKQPTRLHAIKFDRYPDMLRKLCFKHYWRNNA